MDEENNNYDIENDDLEQQIQKGTQIAGKVGNAVSDKTKQLAKKQKEKRQLAKSMGVEPDMIVGIGKKIKGKKYQSEGKRKIASGRGLDAIGQGVKANGLRKRKLAEGIRNIGSIAGACSRKPEIKNKFNGIAKSLDESGKDLINKGENLRQAGIANIQDGMHSISRGKTLEVTGKDIGPNPKSTNNMSQMPHVPNGPNIAGIVNREKRKANLKKIFTFVKSNPKKIAILAVIIIIIVIISIIIGDDGRGKYKEGDNSNVPYVVTSMVMNQIQITPKESGGYEYTFLDEEGNTITLDEALDNAINTLRANKSTALGDLGDTDKERKETLTKLIKAEIATQFPNISNSGGVSGSALSGDTAIVDADVDQVLSEMTLEEKIYQMLMIQTTVSDGSNYADISAGGVIVGSGSNYSSNLGNIGSNYKIKPFVATDDEGGSVERAATGYDSARTYGDNQDYDKLYNDEVTKSNLLLSKGINLNLGPVADIISDSNAALYSRSFSGDAYKVKTCITNILSARATTDYNGVTLSSTLKHYPGYPDNTSNTDYGEAIDDRSMDEINKNIEVFMSAVSAGTNAIMVSNVVYSNYDASNPATLSPTIISDLRKNFQGVIMTDAIDAKAITNNISNQYKKAVIAGNDMLLLDYGNMNAAYSEIKGAVENGEITEDRINESVKRILQWKKDAGLLVTAQETASGNVTQTSNTNGTTNSSDYTVYDYAAWLTHVSYNGWSGYLDHHGYTTNKSNYVSDDGKYYYVQTVNGVLNIGPGIKLSSNADRFTKYGININELKSGDTVDGDIVEAIASEIFLDNITKVKEQATKRGLSLTDNQAQALASVKYSVGNIDKFWDAYNKCGNLEEAAEQFNNASGYGTESFYPVDKNITSQELAKLEASEGTDAAKSASRYLIFKYGIYRSASSNFDQAVQDIINGTVVISANVSTSSSADIDRFLQIADQLYQNISAHQLPYGQGANDPTSYITDNPSRYIDCSSYVSAVLYEYDQEKYSRFAHQQATGSFYPKVEEYAQEYGWTVFYIDENTTINDFQPGDIIIRGCCNNWT